MVGADPHPERNIVYRLTTLPLRVKVILFVGSSLVCAVLSLALHPALGAGSGLFALYLAAFSGLLFGVYGGLAGGALAILLQAWLTLMSHPGELSPDQQSWALTGSLLLGLTGGLVGYMTSLTGRYVVELQKRIQADRELLRQRRQFRQLLDHAGDGIFLIDEDGRVVEWNPRMAELTGLAAEQALGQPGAQVWAASGLAPPMDNFVDWLAETQQSGQAPWNNRLEEIQMLSPDGQARFIQSLSFIIETDHGYQIGGILREITELKQAETNQAEQRIFSQALQQTAGALTSSLRLDEVLEAMLDALQVVVPHDAALILMVSGDCAEVVRSRNFSSEEIFPCSLSIDQTKNLRLMRAMQLPYRIADVHQDPHWIKAHGGMAHLHAYLGAPILVAEEVVGFISLFKEEQDYFTGQHLERLQTFAAQTGVAVRNARLFETAQWRSRQLDRLTELTRLALIGDSFDDILTTLIITIGELFEADQAILLRWDAARRMFAPLSSYGMPILQWRRMALQVQETDFARALLEKGQVIALGRITDQADVGPGLRQLFPDQALIGLPLIAGGQKLGVAIVVYDQPRSFYDYELALANRVADHISLVLLKIQALEVEKQRAFQLARTNAMITALSQVATFLNVEQDPLRIMTTLGERLKSLDLDCLIATVINPADEMAIVFSSLSDSKLEQVQRLVGMTINDFRLNPARFPWFDQVINQRKTVFSAGRSTDMHASDLGIEEALAERVFDLVGVPPDVKIIFAPLAAQEQVLGMLWLWGATLRETDSPAASLFANQVAVALERARLYSEMEKLAITDSLTGSYNRRGLWELGQREVERAERFGRPLAALMLDLDNFKRVNDRFGHPVGDEVLAALAEICRANLREIDVIGRYGGEEFLVLLPEATLTDALLAAERLRMAVAARPIAASAGVIEVTVSVGATAWSADLPDFSRLVSHADLALYQAKNSGRNCVRGYPDLSVPGLPAGDPPGGEPPADENE